MHRALRNGERIVETGFFAGFLQALVVRLEVCKFQEINRDQVVKQGSVRVSVEQQIEIFFRADCGVVVALGAFVKIVPEFAGRAGLFAVLALKPNAFRHVFFRLGGGGNTFAQSFVPTHGLSLIDSGWLVGECKDSVPVENSSLKKRFPVNGI